MTKSGDDEDAVDIANVVQSLAEQGQGVQTLNLPIAAKQARLPGILTAIIPAAGNPRGQAARYFLEEKLSPLVRLLALLDVVSATTAVEGIESQIVLIDMMPEEDRAQEVAAAQARIAELDRVVLLLSVEGQAPYSARIAAERDALCRLLEAAQQPYVPESVLSAEEAMAQAEAGVDSLRHIALQLELTAPPTDAETAAAREVSAAFSTRKDS